MIVIERNYLTTKGKMTRDFEAAVTRIRTHGQPRKIGAPYKAGWFAMASERMKAVGCDLEADAILFATTPLPRNRSLTVS